MGNLNEFFRDLGRNAYGLGENVASLGSAAIAEPVAGFAAMYDPANGAQAIREGMTYQPRTEAGRMYQQGAAQAIGKAVKPVMPVVDTWQKGVDIAGRYSPTLGALMRTTPTALGVALGAKPTLQAGRQASNTLGAMQARMVANATAPRTLNTGYMGQRGAIGTLSTDDDLRALARFNQMDDVYKFDNSHEYYDPIDKLVARNLSDESFDFMELPTSYGKISITPSAKEQGKWQVTQWAKDGNPLSDSGNLTKEKALRVFFEDSRPELLSPALQAGRQVSNSLGAMQARMVANANAPRTLNTGYMGQRGAVGVTNDFDGSDEIKIIADYLGQSPESMLVNRDLYTKKQGAINSLVSRYEQMDDFSGAYYPTSYGYISISPSAKSNGQWQLTSFDHKMNPLSDQGEMSKNKALTEFFKTIKPNKYG